MIHFLNTVNLGKFIKFGLVGGLNTFIDFTIFFLLSYVGIPYALCQAISYSCGVVNSYLINRQWTFDLEDKKNKKEFFRFLVVNGGTLLLSILLLQLGYQYLGWALVFAKVIATLGGMGVNFIFSDRWVFRNKKER
ncbi:GtrA family protein [Salibacterium lacus]|uniref:GtrA family protein n=1 Tax=Salibacterium lacus TaxID=1898109 RepID=A0ABW5T2I9_9BACI